MQLSHQLKQLFPLLKNATNDKGEHITEFSQQVVLPAGTTLFRKGEQCQNYMLVISGSIKVFSYGENGKAIVLYHLIAGNSCILTTSCLLSSDDYPAEGVTESDVIALVIPRDIFNHFIAQSTPFRELVFNTYGEKISSLIALVNNISFSRLERRIAKFLIDNSPSKLPLTITHQNIADELGSAREVVSRQLKEFEKKGWVKLNRGKVEIINYSSLKEL